MTPAIETTGLTKTCGSVTAVAGLNLRAEPGQVSGFPGPNGAGTAVPATCPVTLSCSPRWSPTARSGNCPRDPGRRARSPARRRSRYRRRSAATGRSAAPSTARRSAGRSGSGAARRRGGRQFHHRAGPDDHGQRGCSGQVVAPAAQAGGWI